MKVFNGVKFDNDPIGDSTCEQLFSAHPQPKFDRKKQDKTRNKTLENVSTFKKSKDNNNIGTKKSLLYQANLKNEIKNMFKDKMNSSSLDDITAGLVKSKKVKNNMAKKNKGSVTRSAISGSSNQNKKNKVKRNQNETPDESLSDQQPLIVQTFKQKRKQQKLKDKLNHILNDNTKKSTKSNASVQENHSKKHKNQRHNLHLPLRERMIQKLKSAKFRYLNEEIYTTGSKETEKLFQNDPGAFQAYHQGYRLQVDKWPLNPVDVVIKAIKKMPSSHVIADFGCGEAKVAQSVSQKVHSFDFVSVNETVTACDMAKVPLENASVDVAIFCLSLMGTNLKDYLTEANRVLKVGGTLKIAEVESRFQDVNEFVEGLKRFHFKNTFQDLSHNLFFFLDFVKESNIKNKKKLPSIALYPCLYKKR